MRGAGAIGGPRRAIAPLGDLMRRTVSWALVAGLSLALPAAGCKQCQSCSQSKPVAGTGFSAASKQNETVIYGSTPTAPGGTVTNGVAQTGALQQTPPAPAGQGKVELPSALSNRPTVGDPLQR